MRRLLDQRLVSPCAILVPATFRKPLRLQVDPFLRVGSLFILITSLWNTGSLESLELAVIDWTNEVDLEMLSKCLRRCDLSPATSLSRLITLPNLSSVRHWMMTMPVAYYTTLTML